MTASSSTASSTTSWRRPATCKFGKKGGESFNPGRAGMGGSDKPDLKAEFSATSHVRGTCSMARSQNPNSANSQFFICFTDAPWLNKQYSVWGQVIEGMDNRRQDQEGRAGHGSGLDRLHAGCRRRLIVISAETRPCAKARGRVSLCLEVT